MNLHDKQRKKKEALGSTAAQGLSELCTDDPWLTPLGHDVQRPRIECQSENNEQWYNGDETKYSSYFTRSFPSLAHPHTT
jgi:hypothetical protein